MPTFAELGLQAPILAALKDVGYEEPSPIQAESIPPLMEGRDVIGQAQTGSGKTAAFGLPMINYVDPDEREVQGLVLTPTRELCIQVTQALRTYGRHKGVDVVAVFGGAPIRSQQAQLRAGGHIVVGTVGRVKDLISRHSLVLHSTRYVVLDEADEMLDLGFLEDVEKILSLTPNSRQTALFSATMPLEIQRLADQYLYDPVLVKVAAKTLSVDTVEQFGREVAAKDKPAALVEVLQAERPEQAIVFTRTKIRCDQLYRTLRDQGLNVKALHGDMSQGARDGVMISFKEGRTPILVATDVAARGLDITTVTHVINFDVPTSPDVYVHRIGRTGRAGRSGRAITFYEPRQARELEAIEVHAGIKMAPWTQDAHVAPTAPRPAKPRRHAAKPHDAPAVANGAAPPVGKLAKLIIAGGRADGIEPSDVIGALAGGAGLEGERIRNVRVLERFSLADVPADALETVLSSAVELGGSPLRLEVARS
ncbi:DEAD/DEAH box helicase [Conexibacter sp. DBS9H8]|uniref:DEAD/DEAH box helicase n=1 Tax=Conexibacter sp. DBS9H8 TaxID=2937801 RepID=UPI00200DA589|nr:DEAD/DEAH box helicase [Conexibacter sp. DBS9H8]